MKGPFHYEQLVRIPMIVRWPAGFAQGARTEGLLSQVDIVPTVLSALGLEGAEGLDGVDACPLLRDEAGAVRDHVLIECVEDPKTLRLKTIVTRDRKLTWYAGRDWGELYDLAADPREKRNLWSAPASCAEKARLLGRLLDTLEPTERRAPRYCYA